MRLRPKLIAINDARRPLVAPIITKYCIPYKFRLVKACKKSQLSAGLGSEGREAKFNETFWSRENVSV